MWKKATAAHSTLEIKLIEVKKYPTELLGLLTEV
jgi:hypothetical protein